MKKLFMSMVLILPMLIMTNCSSDDDAGVFIPPAETSTTYQLGSVADPSISGTAKFIKNTDNSTTVELQLTGTPAGGMHPAHIHFNTAAESGDIAITLGTVDGDTGFSTVTFSSLENGTAVTYDELLDFDGYINVHLSATELGTLVAQGDIGQNELTGEAKTYDLGEVDVNGISGMATFLERVNGEALAIIQLDNTPSGGMHPGHIHMNTAAEGGDIIFTFNTVNGDTGMSMTNVANLDDNTSFGYEDILNVDGYINIHESASNLGTLVAQGDIGQNELTDNSITYDLAEVDAPGISGTVMFTERANGEALAVISLINTPSGGMHPAHIHMGSVATAPGDIMFTFTPVDGDTGMSMTNVSALDDDSAFGYSDVLDFDGYVNVHLSAAQLDVLVAQGNIGSNN
ncbi:CHRD domain-containing protein [Bizionia hallyeonensis]|uniref:CHRD domain-containing protein n=1 Tax=Bizionia hallyeonensis TaxID=1123757 RepID=A0ABW0C8W6_9FLAO